MMKKMKLNLVIFLFLYTGANLTAQPVREQFEVVVYGATSAGITAAVAAKKSGASVILLSPEKHIGGLTTSGLGYTDIGNQRQQVTIGGLTRDFFHRIRVYYQNPTAWRYQTFTAYKNNVSHSNYRISDSLMWTFEPHVAEKVFNDLLRENKVPLKVNEWLDRKHGVIKKNGVITSIRMLNGDTYEGKVFIDATYEGDLMAAAGVSYTIGREPNSQYGESINGIETAMAVKNNLPRVSTLTGRKETLQAGCCRECLRVREDRMDRAIRRSKPIATGFASLTHLKTGLR